MKKRFMNSQKVIQSGIDNMIKISVYVNTDKVIFDIFEGEYPGNIEDFREATTQLFRGNPGEWLIVGEYEDPHIKVEEFYKYDFKSGEFVEKSFEDLYLNQTGGWFGMDIDRIFKF